MKNKVRHFRFLNGELTQQELAEKVQVTRQTIISIEKGNFNPSIRLVLKISRVLNTPVEMLFELDEEDLN